MNGLGRPKQSAKWFIRLKRCGLGLRIWALGRCLGVQAQIAASPNHGERKRWRLGREPRFMDVNVRSHGVWLGFLSSKARRVCGQRKFSPRIARRAKDQR